MAYTSGSLLGTYAPQMEEPYQIETALAKDATGGSSAIANTLMNQYWYERQQRESQYADRLANQMAFGQQQLHAQLLDQNMRNMTEAAKVPGVLNMFASSPQYSLPFAGMDPNAIANAAGMAQAQGQANIIQAAGRGIGPMTMAGYNLPVADVSAVTGMPGVTQGPAVPVQAAQINAAGRVAAANARAAASGGPGAMTYSTEPDPTAAGIQFHGKIPPQIAAQGKTAIDAYVRGLGFGGGSQAPNPNATGAVNTAPPAIRGTPNLTNLPPAPVAPPGQAKGLPVPGTPAAAATKMPPPGTILNSQPGGQSLVDQVRAKLPSVNMNSQQRTDLANPVLKVGPDNRVHLHGASGTDYGALPGQGQ